MEASRFHDRESQIRLPNSISESTTTLRLASRLLIHVPRTRTVYNSPASCYLGLQRWKFDSTTAILTTPTTSTIFHTYSVLFGDVCRAVSDSMIMELYKVSYAWYGLVGLCSCIVIGVIVSLLTGGCKRCVFFNYHALWLRKIVYLFHSCF